MFFPDTSSEHRTSRSDALFDARLFESFLRGYALLAARVDKNIPARDRAVPDFMVAFAGAHETASVLTKKTLQLATVAIDH